MRRACDTIGAEGMLWCVLPGGVDLLSLVDGFLQSAKRFSDRPALDVAGESLTYAELAGRAGSLASALEENDPEPGVPLTAVFAYRSVPAFSGVLGALLRGHGYVPLNRTFPGERTRTMLERSGCRALIVDTASAEQLPEVLEGLSRSLLIILPEHPESAPIAARYPDHRVLAADRLPSPGTVTPPDVSPDAIAYLLFTSGSTGIPKGVGVAQRNVRAFIDVMVDRYGVHEGDRFSQTFDMTFDLSVFDMFVCWERGASLHCPSQKELIQPGGFIKRSEITVWFSVPSTGVFMKRLGALKPDSYGDLRWSLFCGEPLPVEVARAWAAAAPASTVENLYGPTEVTIACMLYRWNEPHSIDESVHGVVPIGEPYPGMASIVVDEDLRRVEAGEDGELLMSGPQVTPGYWNDPEKTEAAFVILPGEDRIHYRTGDRVRSPAGDGPMVYLGRVDHQIKIHGHRVELGEIEAVLREESGVDAAIAMGWPMTLSGASGIVAFLGDETVDPEAILERVAARLPDYMVPHTIYLKEDIPLNTNGKFDRNALRVQLEATS